MFLLDTNILSELSRRAPNVNLIAWLRSRPDEALWISVVTIGEIERGSPGSGRTSRIARTGSGHGSSS